MIICLTSNSIRRIYYEYPFSVIRYKRNLFEYHEICLEGMWTDNKTMHRIIRMSWSWRPLRRSKWSLVSFNLFLYPLITVQNTWIKLQASTYVDGIILCYKYLLSIITMIRMMKNWKNIIKLTAMLIKPSIVHWKPSYGFFSNYNKYSSHAIRLVQLWI